MILVTGAAGFIGFHVAKMLIEQNEEVIGIDNFDPYYDVQLKKDRIDQLIGRPNFCFFQIDITDYERMTKMFRQYHITKICHLAAQAGVRYSLTNPFAYQRSNNEGFLNVIELARSYKVENFVYASSSSVYGNNSKLPSSETDNVDNPISLYAATKKSNELVAHCYSHLYDLNCSGLRFFTVYGPWGRPDMATFLFTKAILNGDEVKVFNNGQMRRNFTFVDDIVKGTLLVLETSRPYEIYNIGNNRSESLLDFIASLERIIGKEAKKKSMPIQLGDVVDTVADIAKIQKLGFDPSTNIDEGLAAYVKWHKEYFNMQRPV